MFMYMWSKLLAELLKKLIIFFSLDSLIFTVSDTFIAKSKDDFPFALTAFKYKCTIYDKLYYISISEGAA